MIINALVNLYADLEAILCLNDSFLYLLNDPKFTLSILIKEVENSASF